MVSSHEGMLLEEVIHDRGGGRGAFGSKGRGCEAKRGENA